MRVGDKDVLLPTTMSGGYPRPNWLRGKVFGEFDEPDYIDYGTKEAYEDAVRLCVDDQIRAGFDVVCDGQQYYEAETTHEYGQIFHFWGHRLAGFKRWGDPIKVEPYKKFHAPAAVGDIEWVRPIFAPILEVTRAAAGDRPVKIGVEGPLLFTFTVTDRYYGDPKSLAMAIARAFNKEFKDLTARGVDWIQIHDPLPVYAGPEGWYLDVINTAFDGVDAYKVWHLCYGNQGGNPGVEEFRGHAIFPAISDVNVDQVHIETMRKGTGDLPHLAKLPKHVDVGVGVIDVKSLVIERPEDIADRIVEAARYVPADRLCVSTDCGLTNLKREHAQKKIQALVEGAALARERLSR